VHDFANVTVVVDEQDVRHARDLPKLMHPA